MTDRELEQRIAVAIKQFWRARQSQRGRQGKRTGIKDAGARGAVTGGRQLDGLVSLLAEISREAGIADPDIHYRRRKDRHLPGFYRPTKEWDLCIVDRGKLLACIEMKSQVGSFGNNCNNRTEEAIGNAVDFWTAYRDGAFAGSPRPWLGYFMVLEEAPGSTRPVRVHEPHFPVLPEFKDASYAKRYALLCEKLIRERLYDGACLILSEHKKGAVDGAFRVMSSEVGPYHFLRSLSAHVRSFAGAI